MSEEKEQCLSSEETSELSDAEGVSELVYRTIEILSERQSHIVERLRALDLPDDEKLYWDNVTSQIKVCLEDLAFVCASMNLTYDKTDEELRLLSRNVVEMNKIFIVAMGREEEKQMCG